MSFDATLKELLEETPAAWPWLVGAPARHVEVIDADVATVTGAADKVLLIRDDPPWIHHLEFQSGPDASLPRRCNVYNAVFEQRHDLPVRTSMILLARPANLRVIDGVYLSHWPGGAEPYRTFRYDVIRVWEIPPERLLSGSLSLLPLAPISAVPEAKVEAVIEAIKRRLAREPRELTGRLWTATEILLGLRFEDDHVAQLMKEIRGMEESSTYRAIIAKGEARGEARGLKRGAIEALRDTLLTLGKEHFGKDAGPRIRNRIKAIDEPEELKRLMIRAPRVRSWKELLSDPGPS